MDGCVMIADTITKKIGEALKAGDEIRLTTFRMLSSALNYEKIAKQHELSEEEELVVVQKEAKKRKDAIEAYQKIQGKKDEILRLPSVAQDDRSDDEIVSDSSSSKKTELQAKVQERIKREEEELEILKEYLPEEIGESELVNLVNQVIEETGAKTMADMGKVIGEVKKRANGVVDGSKVAELVKAKLA